MAANPPTTTALAVIGGTNTTTPTEAATKWDVDGDGAYDFALQVAVEPTGYTGLKKPLSETHVYGYGGVGVAAVVGYTNTFTNGTFAYGSKLTLGTAVGPSSTFVQTAGYYTNLGIKYGTRSYGKFTTGTGYLGFEFTAADGLLHYGYLQFATTLTAAANATASATITYVSAFYQSTPNTPITIPLAIPEPGSLAGLAFGAAGVAGAAAYRRKKAAGAATLVA